MGSRLVSMLLVFAMALSFVPSTAFAAYYYDVDIGDIASEYIADDGVTYDYTGQTGLKGNIDTSDTISWPVRIYDYLLFIEVANLELPLPPLPPFARRALHPQHQHRRRQGTLDGPC